MVSTRRRSFCCMLLLLLFQATYLVSGRKQGFDNEKLCCKPVNAIKAKEHQHHLKGSTGIVSADIVGSKPPSCFNKCASCTPCQLVKAASQDGMKIGSHPPSCHNKCNNCVPCQAVQTPMSSSAEAEEGHFTVGFSNYMPETWKCKCGNMFFNP